MAHFIILQFFGEGRSIKAFDVRLSILKFYLLFHDVVSLVRTVFYTLWTNPGEPRSSDGFLNSQFYSHAYVNTRET